MRFLCETKCSEEDECGEVPGVAALQEEARRFRCYLMFTWRVDGDEWILAVLIEGFLKGRGGKVLIFAGAEKGRREDEERWERERHGEDEGREIRAGEDSRGGDLRQGEVRAPY